MFLYGWLKDEYRDNDDRCASLGKPYYNLEEDNTVSISPQDLLLVVLLLVLA